MFTQTPSPASLHSMATRLTQIRLLPDLSRSSKKETINNASSPSESSPSKSNKRSTYSTQQAQRNCIAQTATKSYQAGTRKPHNRSHLQQDSARSCPSGARHLQTTPRKDHYQDWHWRNEVNLMKVLPPRKPLQDIDPNSERRSTTWNPLPRRNAAEKVLMEFSQANSRMSEMHSLIDDYLAWNESSSDLNLVRPGSSGTMFVDFGSNGEMEVSYRNGVNKKLPTPPVPSKIPSPSKATSLRHKSDIEENLQIKMRGKDIKPQKPLPPHPSYSSRHDSVISSGAKHVERSNPYASRPLPRLPSQTPQHAQPQSRKLYPPQVHRTQRSSPQTALAPHSSPSPSHASVSTYNTAPSRHDRGAYTMIEPLGLAINYQPYSQPHTSDSIHNSAARGFVSGHDPATNYTYDYDGHTIHIHRSPSSSRPESWTSEYFDIAASTYSSCKPSPNLSNDPPVRVSTESKLAHTFNKPLPALPRAEGNGFTRLPEPPRADAKKRRKVLAFVQKLLHKLDILDVMKEFSNRSQRH